MSDEKKNLPETENDDLFEGLTEEDLRVEKPDLERLMREYLDGTLIIEEDEEEPEPEQDFLDFLGIQLQKLDEEKEKMDAMAPSVQKTEHSIQLEKKPLYVPGDTNILFHDIDVSEWPDPDLIDDEEYFIVKSREAAEAKLAEEAGRQEKESLESTETSESEETPTGEAVEATTPGATAELTDVPASEATATSETAEETPASDAVEVAVPDTGAELTDVPVSETAEETPACEATETVEEATASEEVTSGKDPESTETPENEETPTSEAVEATTPGATAELTDVPVSEAPATIETAEETSACEATETAEEATTTSETAEEAPATIETAEETPSDKISEAPAINESTNIDSVPTTAPDTPEATDTLAPTDTSESTDVSEPTNTPESTDTPVPADTPESTDVSEPTDTLESTDTPVPTDASESTDTPVPTDTPALTGTTELPKTSESTDTPEPSDVPDPIQNTTESKEQTEMGNTNQTEETDGLEYMTEAEKADDAAYQRRREARKKAAEVKQQQNGLVKEIISWILPMVIAVSFVLLLKTFVIIMARVPSGSMENTIMTGDMLVGNRLAYINSEPERGDIIIFKFPDDESQKYIKRVIGLPGETVEIRDAKVYINGSETPLEEDYLKEEWYVAADGFTFEVPEDCYFVMGDNRNRSADARYWTNTYVARDKIIAKAVWIWFPFSHVGSLTN